MSGALPSFEEECFFITEIGKKDSAERRRADGVLRSIVEPAAADHGLKVVRADQIAKGGQVNLQIIEHICKATSAVADLTGGNLNVYYEVGMRHAVRKPMALMADEGESLPFDLLQQRTIFFANDLEGGAACRDALSDHLKDAVAGGVDSPVDAALNVGVLAQGDETQRALADLVQKVDALTSDFHQSTPRARTPHPLAVMDLLEAWAALNEFAIQDEDKKLLGIVDDFRAPVRHIANRYSAKTRSGRINPQRWEEIQESLGDWPSRPGVEGLKGSTDPEDDGLSSADPETEAADD